MSGEGSEGRGAERRGFERRGSKQRGSEPGNRGRRASKAAYPTMSGEQEGEPQPFRSRAAMSLRQKGPWPSLSHLVLTTVRSCTDRKGASFPFIKNMLATKGYNMVRNGSHLKVAVGALLSKGLLQQVTGSGLTGSFRLGRAGEERAEGTGRRGRAVGEARRRPAGTTKGPRRAVKATARRLKTRRPRGKAAAAGGVEEVGDPAPAEGKS